MNTEDINYEASESEDRAFKYVLQDFSNVFIGTRLTFEELTKMDDSPQRLNSAIFHYMFSADEEMRHMKICDMLLGMNAQSPVYKIFAQLKASVRISVPVIIRDKKGIEKTEYRMKEMKIENLLQDKNFLETVTPQQMTEIFFKKRYLLNLGI